MTRHVHIDRLDLSLRGISPTTAESAAQLLGPALARALRRDAVPAPNQDNLEAAATPDALAGHVAGQLARRIADERS